MIRYALTMLLCLGMGVIWAQAPQGINYQAIAWDANGPLVNQTVDIRLSLFDGATATPDFQETHVVSTNDYGLFNLVIGGGTATVGTFAGIDWGNIQPVIQTEMDNGSGWINLGSSPLQSVPYALHAAEVAAFPINELSDVAATPTNGQVLKWDGTAWIADIDNGTVYTAGAGIDLTGTVISNTGDIDPSDDIVQNSIASGDVTGPFQNLTVAGIQNVPISPIASIPPDGMVLKTQLGQWELIADSDGDASNELQEPVLTGFSLGLTNNPGNAVQLPQYLQGTGINISGPAFPGNLYTITNTGDLIETDDINIGDAASGDLSGTFPTPSVAGIRGISVSPILPIEGQVLKYSALTNEWLPAADEVENNAILLTDGSGNTRVEGGITPNGNGYLYVYDSTTTLRAGIRIAGGLGELFGDVKNFRVPHPLEPEKEIWYASLEGPEAAAYLRGTATLENGKAQIQFPEHFQLIAVEEGMTVLLTPLSGRSRGLAVIEKTLNGFEVVELMEGEGNYRFDWEVKCIRRGHQDFDIIRPATTKP